jgi:hypothetical protein
MNEKPKNVVTGFIGDLIKFMIDFLILTLITFVVVFLLFAPVFSPYFKGKWMSRYECSENDDRVKNRMLFTNLILWIICIGSWSMILYFYIIPPTGCGFQ